MVSPMNVVELIEIALANVDESRVEVMALEPAEFSSETVTGLAELVLELASNAIAFSPPEDKVHIAGLFVQDSYLISISDRGVGISEELIAALNRMLEDPESAGRNAELALGLRMVARMAARNGLAVRLVPGVPGTTARVTVPAKLVRRVEDRPHRDEPDDAGAVSSVVELFSYVPEPLVGMGRVYASSDPARDETEAFLEMVFTPLRAGWQQAVGGGNGRVEEPVETPWWHVELEANGTDTLLRTRVPGESYLEIEDDSPSTTAAEAAVDLRSALSTYDEGRRSAEHSGDRAVG
jgi:hypothetical protein